MPERIVAATHDKLASGTSVKEMLLASALAVVRLSDLPRGHHGTVVSTLNSCRRRQPLHLDKLTNESLPQRPDKFENLKVAVRMHIGVRRRR